MKNYIELTSENFEQEVLNSNIPVVIDFYAGWCAPCKAFAPIFEETAGEFTNKVKFCKVDCDENNALAGQYGVMSIPTILFFEKGELVRTESGMRSKVNFVGIIKELFNKSL